ncbi:ORF6N domain-containing protein [Dyadobacter fanqingshengii]|uniref:ORF6N domain-containing protein n=1 Tax=Dyadobacter fanqingshengii TaxID=2906443 RepID=A0A9X1P9P0_9BACT|nr:ORF6N domain-containing protein [Dyadobacter fanqingshengii]MCF0039282.1 ORF6N domain-containing protein [Dyadobacter fanqingshengii]USJ33901.1 ORF6N domain-containing protein [Dyadobacter fanqingshengii]
MELSVIKGKVLTVRGHRVLLDYDLSALYQVETRILKQAVRRNISRFPKDFMFELTNEELENLRSQFVTSSSGGNRYLPFAFTEQGVAMLSSVLRSEKAVQVNIMIMRAFVMIRQYHTDYKDISERLDSLEKEMNVKFSDVNDALNFLISPEGGRRALIGFNREEPE